MGTRSFIAALFITKLLKKKKKETPNGLSSRQVCFALRKSRFPKQSHCDNERVERRDPHGSENMRPVLQHGMEKV